MSHRHLFPALAVTCLVASNCARTVRGPDFPPAPVYYPASRSVSRDTIKDDIAPVMVTPRRPAPTPRTTIRELIVKDTLAVTRAIRACAGHKLLPEQEVVIDGLTNILTETRAALRVNDLYRARSCSRSARQLASGLDCQ